MRAVWLFILLLVVHPAIAATITNSFTAQGTGAVIRDLDMNWDSGVDNSSIGGNSGSILLTAPGEFQYQTKDHIDATAGNFYNQTGYARFDNGGVFSESLNTEGSDPYQSVVASHYGVLPAAEMETAKTVDELNLDLGQQVAWDGAGNLFRDIQYDVQAQRETMGRTYHYRTYGADHAGVSTNMTGGAIVRPEFAFTSFTDAFIFNDTALAENTTNTTDLQSESMGS